MPSGQSILVLGAGELGSAVLDALSSHPQLQASGSKLILNIRETSLNSSDPEKIKELDLIRSHGISIQSGDVTGTGVDGLVPLFKPFDTIVSCTGMTAAKGTQTKICEAVLKAGVKRYVPWQFGVDYDTIGSGSSQDLFTEQLDVRAMLRSQNKTEWAIFSVGVFTSFLVEPAFSVISRPAKDQYKIMALGAWQNELTATSPTDIGKVVAEVLLVDWDQVKNDIVWVAGDTVTFRSLAAMFATMGDVDVKLLTTEEITSELEKDPGNGILKYQGVWAKGEGVAWAKDKTYNHRKGIQMETVRDYIQRHGIPLSSSS